VAVLGLPDLASLSPRRYSVSGVSYSSDALLKAVWGRGHTLLSDWMVATQVAEERQSISGRVARGL